MKPRTSPEYSDHTPNEFAKAAEGYRFGMEALLERFCKSSDLADPETIADQAEEVNIQVIHGFRRNFGNQTAPFPLVVRSDEGVWVSFTPSPMQNQPYQPRPTLPPWDELLGKTIIKAPEVEVKEDFSALDDAFSGLMDEPSDAATIRDTRVLAPVEPKEPDKTPLIDKDELDTLLSQAGKADGNIAGTLEAYVQEHGFTATPTRWVTTTPMPTEPLELDQEMFDHCFPPRGTDSPC